MLSLGIYSSLNIEHLVVNLKLEMVAVFFLSHSCFLIEREGESETERPER